MNIWCTVFTIFPYQIRQCLLLERTKTITSFYFTLFYFILLYSILFYSVLFIFWLHWVFVACVGFLQLQRAGATLCCGAQASHCGGFSCCGAQALGVRASVVAARRLSSCGTRAQLPHRHVGSSRTRDQTHVPCIGRQILNHCATREVPTITSEQENSLHYETINIHKINYQF